MNEAAATTSRSGGDTRSTGIETTPTDGAMTAVGRESTPADPYWFVARTLTLIERPTSLEPSACVCASAPKSSQLLPALSQRRHWNSNRVGELDHEPVEAVRVCPSRSVPAIVGSAVFTGGGPAGATTEVGAEVASVLPNSFRARTRTRIVFPTSVAATRYVGRSGPTPAQPPPAELHLNHWYANELGLLFQEPAVAVSVCPTCAVPEIVGTAVFSGARPLSTTAVAPEVALAEPSEFVAVTVTRSLRPASALRSRYVDAVAPETFEQLSPLELQRRQR
jgi:hypothetical protein